MKRRHSRWWEACLLSEPAQLLVGSVVALALPAWLLWGEAAWRTAGGAPQLTALIAVEACFLVSALTLRRLGSFPGTSYVINVFPVVVLVFLLGFALILFARLEYSRPLLLLGAVFALAWCLWCAVAAKHFLQLKIATIPVGRGAQFQSDERIEVRALTGTDTEGARFDAVVADLQAPDMPAEWVRFLTQCVLARMPVLDVDQIEERMTGRVHLVRLSRNDAGALLPSALYGIFKRLIDIAGVLIALPVVAPLMICTAVAIRLDSPGPVLFVQNRVGLGNRDFRIFKFRSMRVNAEASGARFAGADDNRITRVGRFIRKTRLDELPQLWNVLVGEMSLIGPRPEQRVFVDRFDAEIACYSYRHVVRPGVTGWAQVMQGYAAGTDETRLKIQYDLYYIKHFSLWLDVLIVLKTIAVIFTGRGAR